MWGWVVIQVALHLELVMEVQAVLHHFLGAV
jgi:hypothetical protein